MKYINENFTREMLLSQSRSRTALKKTAGAEMKFHVI
jgi:hypothetical protein